MSEIDLGPYIREALDRMNVEIEHGAEEKVAAVLRERGWVCISPYQGSGGA